MESQAWTSAHEAGACIDIAHLVLCLRRQGCMRERPPVDGVELDSVKEAVEGSRTIKEVTSW